MGQSTRPLSGTGSPEKDLGVALPSLCTGSVLQDEGSSEETTGVLTTAYSRGLTRKSRSLGTTRPALSAKYLLSHPQGHVPGDASNASICARKCLR